MPCGIQAVGDLTAELAWHIVDVCIQMSRRHHQGHSPMISQTAEYALRATVFLADQDGEPCTTAAISKGTEVPSGYLAKVMQQLSRGKLVDSRRGLHGGFTLRKPADEMTVLEVINAVDPIQRFDSCPLKLPNHGPSLCPLHRKLDDAGRLLEELFGDATVASLLAVPKRRKPMCRFPVVPIEKKPV